MRRDKNIAFKLRKSGKSYREIQKKLGVSRSTLCNWFRDEEWSKHIKYKNERNNIKLSTDRILKLNDVRNKKLVNLYKKVNQEAINDFKIFRKEPLFSAGLMIYAGEGDKRSPNNSRISNSEFYIHKIFLNFTEKYLNIQRKDVKFDLIVYPDLDIQDCVNKWSKELGIPVQNFYKTQIINGKSKNKRLQNGTGISIISSVVVVKKRILKWLELSSSVGF